MRILSCAITLVASLSACTPDNDLARQSQEDIFFQEPTDQVDILWVIDNSLSMTDEQNEVGDKFQSFITSLEDSKLDFHVGVVTTDTDNTAQNGRLMGVTPGTVTVIGNDTPDYVQVFQQLVQVGTDGSDKERGIDAAYKALSEPLISDYNAEFRRDGANLSIIYVSDENDCTDRGALAGQDGEACYQHSEALVSMKDLIADYKTLEQVNTRVLVSAIVGPEIVDNCDGAVPGFRYQTMAEAFGGLQGSICEKDFSEIMSELGLAVSGVLTSFQLSYPAFEGSLEIYVDEAAIPEDPVSGWTYDAEYWIVRFDGDYVPPRGSKITALYEVASAY